MNKIKVLYLFEIVVYFWYWGVISFMFEIGLQRVLLWKFDRMKEFFKKWCDLVN